VRIGSPAAPPAVTSRCSKSPGLLFSGTGVVFSVCQTLNHVAAVPYRLRPGFASRYVRVFVMLAALLLGAVAVGAPMVPRAR
jgi:membrane protein